MRSRLCFSASDEHSPNVPRSCVWYASGSNLSLEICVCEGFQRLKLVLYNRWGTSRIFRLGTLSLVQLETATRILWAEGSCHVRSCSWISSPSLSSERDFLAHPGGSSRLRPSDSWRKSSNTVDQTTESHRVESSDKAFIVGAHKGRRLTFSWATRRCEISLYIL
jgi:hypothetical protein